MASCAVMDASMLRPRNAPTFDFYRAPPGGAGRWRHSLERRALGNLQQRSVTRQNQRSCRALGLADDPGKGPYVREELATERRPTVLISQSSPHGSCQARVLPRNTAERGMLLASPLG